MFVTEKAVRRTFGSDIEKLVLCNARADNNFYHGRVEKCHKEMDEADAIEEAIREKIQSIIVFLNSNEELEDKKKFYSILNKMIVEEINNLKVSAEEKAEMLEYSCNKF